LSESFGQIVDRLQAEKGINLVDLAKLTGMSRQTLHRVKKSKHPHMSTIHKIAKALEVDPSYFFD
jgi:transcriptional regulator with XRE-family HTH domain